MKKICLSTGLFWDMKNYVNVNDSLRKIREMNLPIYGIELGLIDPKQVENFHLTKNNAAFLGKLKFRGIHASKLKYYDDNKETEELIEKLYRIYKTINSDYIGGFHTNWVQNYKYIVMKNWNACIENPTFLRHNMPFEKIKAILNKYPKLNLIFDINHAITCSREEVQKYIVGLRDRIVAVHLGAGELVERAVHTPLSKASKDELKKVGIIKQLDCPFVLESTFDEDNKAECIKEEFKFAQKWLE